METKTWITLLLCAAVAISLILTGCGGGSASASPLTEQELSAICDIAGMNYTKSELTDVTSATCKGREQKFQAVKKVYTLPNGDYAFIAQPVAYNGPLTLALVVDANTNATVGLRIVEHMETDHYVRDFQSAWFTDRFKDKSATQYLTVVKPHAVAAGESETQADNEVVAVTGATVTAQGVANGVNACLGVYQEAVLHETADPVDYMVENKGER